MNSRGRGKREMGPSGSIAADEQTSAPAGSGADQVRGSLVLQAIATAVGGAFLGAMATIATGAFGYLNKNRELDIQMVNIALTILSGDNSDSESSAPARRFALHALSKYSAVEIPKEELEEWVKSGTLPQGVFSLPSNSENLEEDGSVSQLLLARVMYGEARGSEEEMRAVAHVVLNRAASGRFPKKVSDVILQPFQFSSMNQNDPNRSIIMNLLPGTNARFDRALNIAARVLDGSDADPTSGATHYFYTEIKPPSWTKQPNAVKTAIIGRLSLWKFI